MDLPPDKAKRLKNYDNKKKWEMLCDQVSKVKIKNFKFKTRTNVCFVRERTEERLKMKIKFETIANRKRLV